jgi:FkbM family methyltransferase
MNFHASRRTVNQKVGRFFDMWFPESAKKSLRANVMASRIDRNNDFDAEAKLLRSLGIQPVMLDIGANTGAYSAILEDRVNPSNLYLFEPLPHLHCRLKKRFSKAHVFEFGLSDAQKNQTIRIPYIGGKRFDTRATCNSHSEPGQTGVEEVDVCFFPLDHIAAEVGFKQVGFVKIDVEGHELEVLGGAVATLSRFKPLVLIEIETRHHKFPITEIFARFHDLGYRGYYLRPETFELLSVLQFDGARDQDPDVFASRDFVRYLNNFLFVHADHEEVFVKNTLDFLAKEKRAVGI